jgi:hypothetical protein
MGTVNFRTTPEEDAVIATRMLIAGDRNKTEHFKRVYFRDAGTDDLALGELRREVGLLADAVEKLSHQVVRSAKSKGDDLELKLIAGLWMLLYPSVEKDVQADVDQFLDIEQVRRYVEDGQRRRK